MPRFFKILSENGFIENWLVKDQPNSNFALEIVRTSPHQPLSGAFTYALDEQGLVSLANFCTGSIEPVVIAYDRLSRFFIISDIFLSAELSRIFDHHMRYLQNQNSPRLSFSNSIFSNSIQPTTLQNTNLILNQPLSTQIEALVADMLVPIKEKNFGAFEHPSENGILTPPQMDFAPFLFF